MGYKEDILANFSLTIPQIQQSVIQIFIEDYLIDKALDRLLQTKRNLYQGRYRAAWEAYTAKHPEAMEMDTPIESLEEVDPGIAENKRQVESYEQGTISGKVQDSQAKIKNEMETKVLATEKQKKT